jgi:hypothetical protein
VRPLGYRHCREAGLRLAGRPGRCTACRIAICIASVSDAPTSDSHAPVEGVSRAAKMPQTPGAAGANIFRHGNLRGRVIHRLGSHSSPGPTVRLLQQRDPDNCPINSRTRLPSGTHLFPPCFAGSQTVCALCAPPHRCLYCLLYCLQYPGHAGLGPSCDSLRIRGRRPLEAESGSDCRARFGGRRLRHRMDARLAGAVSTTQGGPRSEHRSRPPGPC